MPPKRRMLKCRAKVVDECMHGNVYGVDNEIWEDSTADADGTVVCDACYIQIEPLMIMNTDDIPRATTEAVLRYQQAVDHLSSHPDPRSLMLDAETVALEARPDSPRAVSAAFMAGLASREVSKRASQDR